MFGIGIFFFVPETTYIRHTGAPEALTKISSKDEKEKQIEKGMHVEFQNAASGVLTGNGTASEGAAEPKISFIRSLSLYTGRYTDAAIWKIFARPFIMFVSGPRRVLCRQPLLTYLTSSIPACSGAS